MNRFSLRSMLLFTVLAGSTVSARAALSPCDLQGGDTCTVTVSVSTSCTYKICPLTISPTDVFVPAGTKIKWVMPIATGDTANPASRFTVVFPPDQETVFSTGSVWTSTYGGSAVGDATMFVGPKYLRIAKYIISWTDGTNGGYLDPRVVVSGSASVNVKNASSTIPTNPPSPQ